MKMYCLVRKDLAKSYQAVQGGHAIAEYFLEHGIPDPQIWDNGTMIYLGVKDEESLKRWADKLQKLGKTISCFFEPDIGDQMTTLSLIDDGEVLKKLSLLR